MKFYYAPLEGVSGYIYRNAYHKYFDSLDKYYAPFIVANMQDSFKHRDLQDILPENNKGLILIPQILSNKGKEFIHTQKKIKEFGYDEINLNLGCPSGTVVSKNRGSGFLAKRDELDRFLDEIFKLNDMKISIKTRIGKDSPEEFYEIIKIYNKYPLEELIIHPRTRQDFYGNKPNLVVFKDALNLSNSPVCYNGDIFTENDYNNFINLFPSVERMMIGRGILANPGLLNEIEGNIYLDKDILKKFHDEIFIGYRETFNDDKNAIYRMKELWGYMIYIFSNNKKYIKKIKKSQKIDDYNEAVLSLFEEQEIIKGAGLFSNNEY